jgi:hypothetical protein
MRATILVVAGNAVRIGFSVLIRIADRFTCQAAKTVGYQVAYPARAGESDRKLIRPLLLDTNRAEQHTMGNQTNPQNLSPDESQFRFDRSRLSVHFCRLQVPQGVGVQRAISELRSPFSIRQSNDSRFNRMPRSFDQALVSTRIRVSTSLTHIRAAWSPPFSKLRLAVVAYLFLPFVCQTSSAQDVSFAPQVAPASPVPLHQEAQPGAPEGSSAWTWMPEHECPGGFPSDLTRLNCRYTQRQRTLEWVSTTLTDEATLTSASAALGAFFFAESPTTWPRTGLGYLRDWRASYFSGLGNGTTQYLLNTAFDFNPDHVSCRTSAFLNNQSLMPLVSKDPNYLVDQSVELEGKIERACTWYKRIGHVVLDTVATRKSTLPGKAKLNWPSPRLAGAFAGAYAESPWEPPTDNSTQAIFTRAGESLIVPAIGALFNEYPSLLQVITKPLHRTKPLPVWPPETAR